MKVDFLDLASDLKDPSLGTLEMWHWVLGRLRTGSLTRDEAAGLGHLEGPATVIIESTLAEAIEPVEAADGWGRRWGPQIATQLGLDPELPIYPLLGLARRRQTRRLLVLLSASLSEEERCCFEAWATGVISAMRRDADCLAPALTLPRP